MQLLCSTGTMSRNPDLTSHRQVLRYGPSLAVDGFELLFYPGWYDHLNRIADDLQGSGLRFPAMHTEKNIGVALGSAQPEERSQGVQWLEANCRLARELDTRVVVLHLWGWPSLDDHLEYNLESLGECLDVAARDGVALALETIPGRHADPLSNMYRAVARDGRACIALDTEFLAQAGQLETVFVPSWLWRDQRVRHVHIKDYDGHPFSAEGKRRYLHPGDGTINFPRFFDSLKQQPFDGSISLESPAINLDGEIDVKRIQRSLDFVRSLL